MKLYEVVEIFNLNEEETDQECYENGKELIMDELSNKSSNIIKQIKVYEGHVTEIDAEIKRLQELKKHKNNQITKVKNYIKWAMEEMKLKKVETGLGTFSFRKSTKTVIDNENEIPGRFREIKQTETINKTEIGKELKAGIEVPGARLEVNQNLQVK